MIRPYSETGSKKEQVTTMFDNIAYRYDFLNSFLSVGIDRRWRKKALQPIRQEKVEITLDLACGTGDFSFTILKMLKPLQVIGVDLSEKMLEIAQSKTRKMKLQEKVHFIHCDCENLIFDSNKFDLVTVAFGVRNFENPDKGIAEMFRVLKPGGIVVVLEFSKPKGALRSKLFKFYFNRILPIIGRMVSKDISAYRYLPESVNVFPSGKEFQAMLETAGFVDLNMVQMTFGVATAYYGRKPR